jgi:hypothetical protein
VSQFEDRTPDFAPIEALVTEPFLTAIPRVCGANSVNSPDDLWG